jgi:hypothetical protein
VQNLITGDKMTAHVAAGMSPKYMTQAEFSRRRDVSRNAVTTWKKKGLLVTDDAGRVDVEASEWILDQRPATYRGGVTHRPVRGPDGNNSSAPPATAARSKPRPSQSDDDDGDGVGFDLDAEDLPLAEAVRRKENYLGLLRRRELEVSNTEWVRIEAVAAQVEREYGTVRERLLTIPGKIAASLVGADRPTIDMILRREITEALHELHDPSGLAQRAGAGVPADTGKAGS